MIYCKIFTKAALVFSATAILAGQSHAFHPLSTEDTGFLGKGIRQVETAFEHTLVKSPAEFYGNNLGAAIAYGVSDKCDLIFGSYWQAWTSGGASASGPGDTALEAKQLVARHAGWDFVLKPGFSLPTGDADKALGSGKTSVWLHVVAGRTSGPWQYLFNAGYSGNRNSSGERSPLLSASAAAALAVTSKVSLAADMRVETNPDPEAAVHPVSSILAIVFSPSGSLALDAGVRLGLNGAADDLGLLTGITFRF